jgi:hypothetical protein
MADVQSVVADPADPGRLAIAKVDAPHPARIEAAVAVRAFALNRGEVRMAQTARGRWAARWAPFSATAAAARLGGRADAAGFD